MARRKPDHDFLNKCTVIVKKFANDYDVPFRVLNDGIHLQLRDETATVNLWPTSHRYYIERTDYITIAENLIERGGEKGLMPKIQQLELWLAKIFLHAQ